jgi:thymidylate kinase
MQHRRRPGHFVAIGGPDGVGKTSAARALLVRYEGPTGYVHFRPAPFTPLPPLPPATSQPPPTKTPPTGPRPLGWARLAAGWARFWLGYLTAVRPALRAGALVVADRWAYGYVVQPQALRFAGPAWLARLAVRLLPQPDLFVNLVAPVDVIRSRKAELSVDEIAAELRRWAAVPATRHMTLDASDQPDRLADEVLRRLGSLP